MFSICSLEKIRFKKTKNFWNYPCVLLLLGVICYQALWKGNKWKRQKVKGVLNERLHLRLRSWFWQLRAAPRYRSRVWHCSEHGTRGEDESEKEVRRTCGRRLREKLRVHLQRFGSVGSRAGMFSPLFFCVRKNFVFKNGRIWLEGVEKLRF